MGDRCKPHLSTLFDDFSRFPVPAGVFSRFSQVAFPWPTLGNLFTSGCKGLTCPSRAETHRWTHPRPFLPWQQALLPREQQIPSFSLPQAALWGGAGQQHQGLVASRIQATGQPVVVTAAPVHHWTSRLTPSPRKGDSVRMYRVWQYCRQGCGLLVAEKFPCTVFSRCGPVPLWDAAPH